MARKLTSEEESAFARALQSEGHLASAAEDDVFLQSLSDQRDAGLPLSPELDAWLGEKFPPGFHS